MKAALVMGIVCMSAALASTSPAVEDDEDLGDLEESAYDVGWEAAHDYCEEAKTYKLKEPSKIISRFKRHCKKGFDDYIDGNRSCRQRIRRENLYQEMWEMRQDTCT
jgi:hypothetical protein